MKDVQREYPQLSACGLNCGLCPRYHTDGSSRCPGCGGKEFSTKHPLCGVISCTQRHGEIEYCYLCEEYPCAKYDNAHLVDSFITHQNMRKDFEKVKTVGLAAYQAELNEKMEILQTLLEHYNEGRRKSFFCIAVNLLDIQDVRDAMKQIEEKISQENTVKENAAIAAGIFQAMADKRNISLKLRKKS